MNEVLADLNTAMRKNERRDRKFHIVFIGASGAGKTSMLNLIGHFGVMNERGLDGILAGPKHYNDVKLERALQNTMASKTSASKSYDIKIGDVTLMITDTPGLGVDSAGIGKEKEHVENIVEHLKKVEYVNCIFLVINGRTPREIPELNYALSEISAILPNVVTNNMIICLTNCKKISNATLEIATLNKFFKREIGRNDTFCIDNPLCILENAKKLNQVDEEIEDIKHGFELASKEFNQILGRFKDFNQLSTTSFMEVYKAKQAVESEVLAITVHQHNLEQLQKQGNTKSGRVRFSKVVLIEDQHYNTLCDHPGCYSNCHLQCNLPHSYDAEIFKNCICMAGSSQPGVCTNCKHTYVTHYHQYVRFDRQVMCMEYDKIAAQIKQESTQALDQLSTRIQSFHKLSSIKNYIQVLSTQLEVVKLYQKTYGPTEALKTAQVRLESAIETIKLA